ncbi:GNAT family N-acetyltransferase [Amycolatopsis keratiniphila]|uniref:Cyclic nucleotide-binding protein n=1 Tax=Amycolatopsis keratiniphila TaxID=129921 RepID=R4T8B7_9PSEU|nr:GNAT family N-acetyltransferase [Amycolatopsis keratiniphila]AGM07192.1 cyclic nucleotide-binding protein [Amycolatopsis keratiniphila]
MDGQPVRLRDGRTVFVTRVSPADAEELGEALVEADRDTLYRRFCGPPPKVTPRLLAHLTELDFDRRYALVARDEAGKGVAIARYEATIQPGVAEIAVAVKPGWRRAGLATALVTKLAEAASRHGFSEFAATYLADNRAVADLLDSAGARRVITDGLADAAVRLPSQTSTVDL